MDIVTPLASQCRVATASDSVLNSECCYSFHSPFTSDKGILVNLSTWMGACQAMANGNSTDEQIFVRIVKKRVEKPQPPQDDQDGSNDTDAKKKKRPTVLGIGVDGGFASETDKYDTISTHSVVVMQQQEILVELPYTAENKTTFPTMVAESVESILHHSGTITQQDVKVWQLDTDEQKPVSKHASSLPFVDNGVVIDPNPESWKCAKSGATENLWVNLSDGYIGGGRKNWDGSGGSNGALDHFLETGSQYPLVVKLGTITADLETADCYSYANDEDGPVTIPNLAELLEKRGIKVAAMQKTVKSTAELEVELNANYAFDAITEAGAELTPLTGPGLQGLQNLGNSCYMNSVLQLFLSGPVPELQARYGTTAHGSVTEHPFATSVSAQSAPLDLLCQTAKVACALTSGAFARSQATIDENLTTEPKYRLAPRMFKHVIGKDHVDFRTGQQQDAAQFLQYLLERMDRAELGAAAQHPGILKKQGYVNVSSHLFSFKTTERRVCISDGKVKYKDNVAETIWSIPIPMDKAVVIAKKEESGAESADNDEDVTSPDQKRQKSQDEKEPVPTIGFDVCVDEWARETSVDDVAWPHLKGARHPGTQNTRLSNFPRYLIVQMQRYQLGPDWAPIKLEVNLEIGDEIDLEKYKSRGPQDGEDLIPDDDKEAGNATSAAPSRPVIDEAALAQLMDMGFSLNSCKRALNAVGGNNVEAAMSWVFEHNMDTDFNDPLPDDDASPSTSAAAASGVDEGAVQSLVASLGCFTSDQVRAALEETTGAADRAADWLFSHMDDLDGAIAALKQKESGSAAAPNAPTVPLEDGQGKYSMVGMISHIGKNTGSGHYVAHLKKEGKWVIFNDEKVALSSHPPTEHAYLYMFQRKDTIGVPNQNY